ncbi:PREDICTED: ervatamin-B-like [Camelina sativa]|uniref:Ervatamin-B-like n=1 Tax=Camelina sativa TaxID=90675 RepID=A0ABM1QLM0_CAMSA|nr:PREDICTED: ervatamin-B-like [Camelina sativa]
MSIENSVDDFAYLTDPDDDEFRAFVRRQPVIGILRNPGFEFSRIGSRIYRSPLDSVDRAFHQVLIIGYGFDSNNEPYWIIQNSHGDGWGVGGFGHVHRRIRSGQGSEFFAVAYPIIRGYPRSKDEA